MRQFILLLIFLFSARVFSAQVTERDAELKWVKVSVDNADSVDLIIKTTVDSDCNTTYIGVDSVDLSGGSYMMIPSFMYSKKGCIAPPESKTFRSKMFTFKGMKLGDEWFVSVGLLIPKDSQVEIVKVGKPSNE